MITLAGQYGGTASFYVNGNRIGNTSVFGSYEFGANSFPDDLCIGGWDGAIDYAEDLGFALVQGISCSFLRRRLDLCWCYDSLVTSRKWCQINDYSYALGRRSVIIQILRCRGLAMGDLRWGEDEILVAFLEWTCTYSHFCCSLL